MKGTVYVVVEGRWPGGDASGSLLLDFGEVLWSHLSSSLSWLKSDLTTGFVDRRVHLADRYPDGYDVVVVDIGDEIPEDVLARNGAWRAETDAEEPSDDRP